METTQGVPPHLRHQSATRNGKSTRDETTTSAHDHAAPGLENQNVSMGQWSRVAADRGRPKDRNGNHVNRPRVTDLVAMEKTDRRGRLRYPHEATRMRIKQQQQQRTTDSVAYASEAPPSMHDPNLDIVKIPRPDGRYKSPLPSIPSVSSLGHGRSPPRLGDEISDTQVVRQSPDIRGKLAPKHKLESHNGAWVDTSFWSATNEQANALVDPLYVNPWIQDWAQKDETEPVFADFLYEVDSTSHCHSDVNTYTGKLLSPIEYPYTAPDYMTEWSDSPDHQMNLTSSLFIHKKMAGKQSWNKRVNAPSGLPRFNRGWTETVASTIGPPSAPQKILQQTQQPDPAPTPAESTGTDTKPQSSETEVDPYQPLVECHIRPAGEQDMQDALDIYNWEVTHGDQALDTQKLALSDLQGLLKQVQGAALPFVVVLSGAYHERKFTDGWESASASINKWKEQFPQIKIRAKATGNLPSGDGMVLAFGFIAIRQVGLTGSLACTGRKTGLLRTFVHPDYHGKRVDEACMDSLLSMVSHQYSSKLDLFRNHNNDPVYQPARQLVHDFVVVYLEHLVPRLETVNQTGKAKFVPNHTEITRIEGHLKTRFTFHRVARLDGTHHIDPYNSMSERARPEWVDTLVFEHACHRDGLYFGNA